MNIIYKNVRHLNSGDKVLQLIIDEGITRKPYNILSINVRFDRLDNHIMGMTIDCNQFQTKDELIFAASSLWFKRSDDMISFFVNELNSF